MTTEYIGPKCLSKTCTRLSVKSPDRGLCLLCYSRAKKMVESGATTWTEIVALGLALPSSGEDPFTQAFDEAKERRGDAIT